MEVTMRDIDTIQDSYEQEGFDMEPYNSDDELSTGSTSTDSDNWIARAYAYPPSEEDSDVGEEPDNSDVGEELDKWDLLANAIQNKDEHRVSELLEDNDFDYDDIEGALERAVRVNSRDIIEQLLEPKNFSENEDLVSALTSVLFDAASYGRIAIVRYLTGTYSHAITNDVGQTAFIKSISGNELYPGVAKHLLRSFAIEEEVLGNVRNLAAEKGLTSLVKAISKELEASQSSTSLTTQGPTSSAAPAAVEGPSSTARSYIRQTASTEQMNESPVQK
jgi:hypothetical protein